MSTEEKIVWRRIDNSRQREPIVGGRRISQDWLAGTVELQDIRLGGAMRQALGILRAAAKDAKLNLPITSLRTAMIVALDAVGSVVSVDRDLGLSPKPSGDSAAAVQLSSYGAEDDKETSSLIRKTFSDTVRRWVMDDVLQWAETHQMGDVAARLLKAISPSDVELSSFIGPYIDAKSRPNYSLIGQILGRQLAGATLFEGLGPCEVIAFSEPNSNVVELMTRPVVMGRDVFSMVARVRISSVPYSKDVFLSVTAVKRVWARKEPKLHSNMPRSVLGYVVAADRPITPIAIRRTESSWVFGDEYAALYRASEEKLPKTLAEAIDQREFNLETGWWVGLPELPSLFRSLSPRTVFEGDEIDLLNTVCSILSPIVIDRSIAVREIRRAQSLARPLQEMLKISDFGFAGAALFESDAEDDEREQDGDTQEADASRIERIEAYRQQNCIALQRSRGDIQPIVWMIGGAPIEADLARRTIGMLFGQTIEFIHEPMPSGVHGLRANLDGAERLPARARFDKRVAAWEPHTKIIQEKSGVRPTVVLVCARDRYDNRPEDPVNYYAGIHAMSLIDANVHYVLPMEADNDVDEQQHFVHRLQSALLDVLLAHPGLVFGVREFVGSLLPPNIAPKAIYGIQAVRSRARSMSGETSVSFVLFTRLLVDTGMTEIRAVYRAGRNSVTEWMPLSAGLNWVGRMRTLQDSDEQWLRANFTGIVRDELVRIAEEDPNAVVMIDWTTVANLWKGIRDEDLTFGHAPMLDDKPLTLLKGMTFIRLRRGDNVMSLRGSKTSIFRAWKHVADGTREQLGEQHSESYYTTERNIVELQFPDMEESARHRHFIASMGYSKTVQIPRGLSCYRPVVRMKNIGSGFFTQDRKAPATLDAALPAPMDITVMNCPEGVSPDVYAALVTGLRLGYAHYNDWTGLPAPLFFRQKVDDYIIRYVDETETANDVPDRNEVVLPEATHASQDVVAEILSRDVQNGVESVPALVVSDSDGLPPSEVTRKADDRSSQDKPFDIDKALAAVTHDPSATEANEKLLIAVKSCRPIHLVKAIGDNHRLFQSYHRLISSISDREAPRVRVGLPEWVKPKTALATRQPFTKKSVRRCWDAMVDFGYVCSGVKRPADDNFLSWLGQFLVVPQACVALSSITRPVGPLAFRRINEIVEAEYLPSTTPGEIDPFNKGSDGVGKLTKWACANKHDELLGWLIFEVAQWTAPDWVSAVIDNVTCIPGDRTLDAMLYYVNSIDAMSIFVNFVESKVNFNKFEQINLRPSYIAAEFDLPVKKIDGGTQTSAKEISAEQGAPRENDTYSDMNSVMAARNILRKLIEELSPGAASFDSAYENICGVLEQLRDLHGETKRRMQAESALADRLQSLIARQHVLLETLIHERDELMIGDVLPKDLPEDRVEEIEAELISIQTILGELAGFRSRVIFEGVQPAATVAERRQVMTRKAAAEAALVECVEGVHTILEKSICFKLRTPGDVMSAEALAPNHCATDEAEFQSASAIGQSPILSETTVTAVAPETAPSQEVQPANEAKLEADSVVTLDPSPASAASTPALIVKSTAMPKSIQESSVVVDPPAELAAEPPATLASVEAFDQYVVPLRSLLDQRLYGLAAIHVAALGRMADESANESLVAHHAILQALIEALDGMDCQFSFDMRLNDSLNVLLSSERLPTSSYCEPAPMALGVLAAGIGNMLFDESDVRWRVGNAVSARLQKYKSLSALVEHIDTIRQRGYVITRDAFVASRIGDKVAIERELARFQRRAADWKHSHEIYSNFNHLAFKALHEEIFSPKNPIGACIAAMAKGDAAKVRTLFDEAHQKFKKAATTIEELWKKIGERGRAEGLYRNQAVSNIEVTARLIQGYLEHVDRSKSQRSELPRDTSDFLVRLAVLLREALSEVETMELTSEISHLYAEAAVKAIGCVMRLYETTEADFCISNDKQKLLVQLPLGRDLMPAMGSKDGLTPSLCSPAEVLAETTRWADAALVLNAEGGGEDIDSALKDAFDRHLDAKRFLLTFLIERHIKTLVPSGNTLSKRYNVERESLQAELQDARQRVTHAMTLSALPMEAETSRMQRIIEELLSLVRQDKTIGHCDGDSGAYPDFPQARAALRAFVLNPLERRLEAAKEKLVTELNEEAENDSVSKLDIERIRRMLDSNNAATLRTAHDALAILKQSGKLPAYSLNTSFDMAGEYEQFMKEVHESTAHKPLLEGISALLKSDFSEEDAIWLKSLDREQRTSALELIQLWTKFFEKRSLADQDLIDRLFREMGVPMPPIPMLESGRGTRGRLSFMERAFAFPTTAEEPLFIPPSLGTWGTHIEGYVLYGNVSDNDLRLVLQEAASTPTLVFARTKLSMTKRAALTNNLPAIIVDDELIAYMALHPNERLQCLMKVGILTYSTNPYDDYDSQPVPPEMFFGRQDELRMLRNVKSLAVLYGGRRLGKSSLLAQIEHEENQKPGHHAVLISMQTVDVVGDHILSAWEFISNQLARRKIIPQMTALARDWKQVRKHVETALMNGNSVKNLYLLLDEADNLMGRELKVRSGGTQFVETLVQFMNDITHVCAVRLVIAGLHNVTRMTNEENTVFGKAASIALKPFSTSDDIGRGIRLITKPLAAMGYLFKEEAQDLPLRILAVCNFYPAFVQLYCKRLVDQLQNNRQMAKPPMYITTADLDAVEADNTLLTNLRRKFEYNLDLDKRYKVIALALADIYYSEVETGHYRGLPVNEIRDYCEVYGGARFENVSSGVYEALLDEMMKLNVVERVGTRYVLRNPQIAMMIGDRDRIKVLLDDISRDPPDTIRNHGERRCKMMHARVACEFPMPMAWVRRQMDPSDGELLILSGNAMSGIYALIQMERHIWTLREDYSVIPVLGTGPNAAVGELERLRRKPLGTLGKMLVVRPAGWKIDQIKEYVSAAKKGHARIVLLADPVRSYELMQHMEHMARDGTLGAESERGWSVVPITPWSEDAVYFRISENGENLAVADSREALGSLLKASCGFGRELSTLCTSSLRFEQALALPKNHRKVIAPSLDVFYHNVGLPQSFLEPRQRKMEDFLYVINDLEKHSSDIEDAMNEYQVSPQMFDYLFWMGLIQEGPKNCWIVPELYLDLMREKGR